MIGSNKKLLQAAAGNAGGESLYVEDVFSTYLYTGNGSSTQTITNGIDLAGEGGLAWFKNRGTTDGHMLVDTLRGWTATLQSNTTGAATNFTGGGTFNSDGFTASSNLTDNANDYVSWTFRKAEKFFDVVTYTGNGVAGREIAHNLGSAPAVIIIKSVSFANNWLYNHNFGASGYDLLYLDLTNAKSSQTYASGAIQAQPTDSSFTLKNSSSVNGDGNTYVAYLFASDAGGFGDDGDENIIKCGSFAHNYSGATVDCGFEPQWILVKAADQTNNWYIFDVMRGIVTGGLSGDGDAALFPNTSGAENVNTWGIDVNATGFTVYGNNILSSGNAIYIAIRRPMKTPESGTEVFAMDTLGSTGDGNQPGYRSPFPVDMGLKTSLTGNQRQISTRLLQGTELLTESTAAEAASASKQFDYMNGTDTSTATSSVNMMWMFKRATGFFDVVAYTGTGSATTQAHNLGVVPELMIIKRRDGVVHWAVYSAARTSAYTIALESSGAEFSGASYWNGTEPTASVFTVNTHSSVNQSGGTYIAYLFATLAGVSKVGSYTGTGADLNVDCGFSAGARFILIKRTDDTGDWYVYDSLRGIVAGNDPYFFLNNTAAQVTNTDYIDPLSSGFTVTSSAPAALNASGGTYIFLSIA
jgi:hypothetical protein